MKKYIYLACALLAGVFASCSQSETGDGTPLSNHTILKVTADAGLQTRGAATGVDRFAIEVYTDAAYTTAANVFADGTNKATNATGEFAMILDRTQEYHCLLWADKSGSSVYNIADLKAVTLTGKAVEAWQGTKEIGAGAEAALTATLNRAVSKISLLETGKLKAGTVKLNFDQPTTFNVADGTTTGTATPRAEETITLAADVDGSTTAAKLNATDIFVLSSVATADVTDLTFQYGSEAEFTVSNVPLKANFNTNIKGHYSTAKAGPTFSVTCDDTWGTPDNDVKLPITWATGNLVADGKGGCKIGRDTDCGLFFQFGSLIGWSGSANANGTGTGDNSVTLSIAVKPATCTVASWNESWTGLSDPSADPNAKDEAAGTGDPCRYYLGGTWRLPTNAEFGTLFPRGYSGGWSWDIGAKSASHTAGLKLPASGYRGSDGSLDDVGSNGCYWSASPAGSTGYNLDFNNSFASSGLNSPRVFGFAVRCVRSN